MHLATCVNEYELAAKPGTDGPVVHFNVLKEIASVNPDALKVLHKELLEAGAKIVFDEDAEYKLPVSISRDDCRSLIVDFDAMSRVAEEFPEAAEKLRLLASQYIINSAGQGQQRRLDGLMFEINSIISSSSNPLLSCMRLSQMMGDSYEGLRLGLNVLSGAKDYVPGENIPEHVKRAFLGVEENIDGDGPRGGKVISMFKDKGGAWSADDPEI